MIRATPPALWMSSATKRPPGTRSARIGVRSAISPNSSMVKGTPKLRAIARRCSRPLVDPPVAATDATAFSRASRVTIVLGRMSSRTSFTASSPVARAAPSFSGNVAGMPFIPAGEMPRNSRAVLIVLAVNWPPQAPAPGHATFSSSHRSRPLMLPAS